MNSLRLLLLGLFVFVAGCVSYEPQYFVGSGDQVLATVEGADGVRTRFQLAMRSTSGDAVLVVQEERPEPQAELGLSLVELERRRAEPRGVQPYLGLLVNGVDAESAAASAGVLQGDIVLAANDTAMVYRGQWNDLVDRLDPEQPVVLRILRGQTEMELSVQPGTRMHTRTSRVEVPLEAPAAQRAYAGTSLRGLPLAQAERIYGSQQPQVLVSAVEVGSPAWVAGVRAGDRIVELDGGPVPDVHALAREIAARGAQRQSMRWVVQRGQGERHVADLKLRDYRSNTRVWVPLVFWLDSKAEQTRWSAGPLGLLLNNRNQYVADSSSRQLKTRNVFNAVLGLFHVDTGPDTTSIRLLWFIQFDY